MLNDIIFNIWFRCKLLDKLTLNMKKMTLNLKSNTINYYLFVISKKWSFKSITVYASLKIVFFVRRSKILVNIDKNLSNQAKICSSSRNLNWLLEQGMLFITIDQKYSLTCRKIVWLQIQQHTSNLYTNGIMAN